MLPARQDVFFGCVESVRPCSLDSGIPCRNDGYSSMFDL